jgi:hypothetical protein
LWGVFISLKNFTTSGLRMLPDRAAPGHGNPTMNASLIAGSDRFL